MKDCKKLNNLPESVQKEVIEVLKAWTGCYVEKYENGNYQVAVGVALTKGKQNFKVIESFENSDIFTQEEIEKYAHEVWGGCDMSAW